MTAALTATEALLSVAAAETAAERHLARLALIATGGDVVRPLDLGHLTAGDGTAGHRLLGGGPRVRVAGHHVGPSTAIRSRNIAETARIAALDHRSDGSRIPTCLGCEMPWPCLDADLTADIDRATRAAYALGHTPVSTSHYCERDGEPWPCSTMRGAKAGAA